MKHVECLFELTVDIVQLPFFKYSIHEWFPMISVQMGLQVKSTHSKKHFLLIENEEKIPFHQQATPIWWSNVPEIDSIYIKIKVHFQSISYRPFPLSLIVVMRRYWVAKIGLVISSIKYYRQIINECDNQPSTTIVYLCVLRYLFYSVLNSSIKILGKFGWTHS